MKKGFEVPFIENGSEIPMVEFIIDQFKLVALIDTGAEITLLDKVLSGYVTKKESDVSNISLVGISGSKQTPPEEAFADITFKDKRSFKTVKMDFLVSNLDYIHKHFSGFLGAEGGIAMIIGSDFLNKTQAHIDYNKKVMVI